MREKIINTNENTIYDVNNPNLYLNLDVKEVFEWIETTNEFIWKTLTKEQQEQQIENRKKKLYKA
ncbi:MAG: hypothetical protein IPK18_13175 [Sphingobacteriales bacterium]|jgi:hypothetical protein|nr:MAG: hypothetical protein IPK18_13175 [Sphingobacteriales bacterium]